MGGPLIGRLFYEIGGDQSKLNESLKQAMDAAEKANVKITRAGQGIIAAFDNALNPTKRVEEELKLLELAGKNSGDVIAVMGQKIKTATDAARAHGQPVSDIVQRYADLAKGGDKAGFSIQALGKGLTSFASSPVESAKAGISSFLTTLGPTAVGLAGIGTAAVAAGSAIFKMGSDAAAAAEHIDNLSKKTGLSFQQVQQLQRVGEEAGLGDLTDTIARLNVQLGSKEGGDFVEALLRTNVALKDETGGALDAVSALDALRDRYLKIPDPVERSQRAIAELGAKNRDLLPLVLNTSQGIKDAMDAVAKSGIGMTDSEKTNLLELDRQLDEHGRTWEGLKTRIGVWAGEVTLSILKMVEKAEPALRLLVNAMPTMGFGGGRAPADWEGSVGISRKTDPLAVAGEGGQSELDRRRDLIARAEATAAGVRRDLLGVTNDLREAEGRLAAEIAKKNSLKQFDPEVLQAAADEVAMIKKRRDAIEASHKAEIDRINDLSKGTQKFRDDELVVFDLEREMRKAIEQDDLKRATRIADFLGKLREWIELDKEIIETEKKARISFLSRGADEVKGGLKKNQDDTEKRLREFGAIQSAIDKETNDAALDKLRLEEKIVATITPMSDIERTRIELEKNHLKYAIQAEEIRVKWTQKREDLMEKIRKFDNPNDPLRLKALKEEEELTAKMRDELKGLGDLESAEAIRIHNEEYKKMIDSVRDGAGKVFDAITARGKGAFQNLSDWLEGVFLTRLRRLFENLVESIFTPSSGKSWWSRLFEGVLPRTSTATAAGFSPAAMGFGNDMMRSLFPSGLQGFGSAPGKTSWWGSLKGGVGGLAGGLSLAVPGLSAYAAGSRNPYVKGLGYTGLGITGGAAIASLATTGGLGATGGFLGAALTNPWTAAAAGAVLAGIGLAKVARGKNAWTAGGMETSRDFGVDVSGKAFKAWAEGLGLTESRTYPMRKDLMSSPLFLTQVAEPAAKAQGKMDEFLKSLEGVKTAWGTFDFRKAFELGDVTGDWSELDKVFKDAFKDSDALRKGMPNWEEALLIGGSAAKEAAADFQDFFDKFKTTGEITDEFEAFLTDSATLLDTAALKSSLLADELLQVRAALVNKPTYDSLKALKEALEADVEAADDMYTQFYKTGEITDEFAAKIKELGGELAKFEEAARLAKINTEFADLSDTFRQTGEVLPRLRDLFKEFGGDLSVLDDASGLMGLYDSLDSIDDFIDGLERLLDAMSPIQQVLAGDWGADTWAGLADLGLDPSKLTGLTDLIKFTKDWDKTRADFERGGKLTRGGTLEQALYLYGGAEGSRAIEQYRKGFNVITPGLLDTTKAALDRAYKDELKTSLDYLKDVEKKTNDKIDKLNDTVEAQLTIVGKNITDALNASKDAVVIELDKMLAELKTIALNTTPPTSTTPTPDTTGGGDTGDEDRSRSGGYENYAMVGAPETVESTSSPWGINVYIDNRGARLAPGDVKREVEDAIIDIRRRGGLRFLTR